MILQVTFYRRGMLTSIGTCNTSGKPYKAIIQCGRMGNTQVSHISVMAIMSALMCGGCMMINLNVEALTHNDVRGYVIKDYIDLIC